MNLENTYKCCECIVSVKNLFEPYTYKIPSNLISKIKIGSIVVIKFRNKFYLAICRKLIHNLESDYEITDIEEVIDDFYFDEKFIEFCENISDYYLCSLGFLLNKFIPAYIKENILQYLVFDEKNIYKLKKKTSLDKIFLDILSREHLEEKINNLLKKQGILLKDIKRIKTKFLKKAIIKQKWVYEPLPSEENKPEQSENYINIQYNVKYEKLLKILNADKYIRTSIVFNRITEEKEFYKDINYYMLKNSRKILLIFNNINELVSKKNILESIFKENIIFYHGKLTKKQRITAENNIYRIKNKYIIAGSLNALFIPERNIDAVIFVSTNISKTVYDFISSFDLKKAAILRSKFFNIPFMNITNAVDIYDYYSKINKKSFIFLNHNEKPKKVKFLIKNKENIFDYSILKIIKSKLKLEKNIIILNNFPHYSKFIICKNCDYKFECHYCKRPLFYSKEHKTLYCGICNYSVKIPDKCPNCKEIEFDYLIPGYELLKEKLIIHFDEKLIKRIKIDNINKKTETLIETILSEKNQIILTDNKILNFHGEYLKNIGLVIINDLEYYALYPSLYGLEKLIKYFYSIIYNFSDKNIDIAALINFKYINIYKKLYDLKKMYFDELKNLKDINFPPITDIILFKFENRDFKQIEREIEIYKKCIRSNIPEILEIFDYVPNISIIRNKKIKYLMIKLAYNASVGRTIKKILKENKIISNITVSINPEIII